MATLQSVVPPPPRLTGDYQADVVILNDWVQAFYNAVAPQLQNALLINQALANATAKLSGFPLSGSPTAAQINAALGAANIIAGISPFPLNLSS